MKKHILLFTFAIGMIFANAQSIEFRLDTLNGSGPSVNGQTFYVYGSPTDIDLRKDLRFVQASGSTMDVRAKIYEVSIGDFQIKHSISWITSYAPISPTVYTPFISPSWSLADTSITIFTAHYWVYGTSATSEFRYVIFDDNNPSDSAYVNVVFTTNALSVQNMSSSTVVLNAYPNPATDNFLVNYAIKGVGDDAKLNVYDVLGQKLMTKNLDNNEGQVRLSLENVNSGVYFYSIEVAGKAVKTEKFIVK